MAGTCTACKHPREYDDGDAFEAGRYGIPYHACECLVRPASPTTEYARVRHQARSAALYAHVVAERYSRLVESSEPADAMTCAIGEAEEVVRVWEEVVDG